MRAKFINEKFVEDSDPVKDMGIGAWEFTELSVGSVLQVKKELTNENKALTRYQTLSPGTYLLIYEIKGSGITKKIKFIVYFEYQYCMVNKTEETHLKPEYIKVIYNKGKLSIKASTFKNNFKVIEL